MGIFAFVQTGRRGQIKYRYLVDVECAFYFLFLEYTNMVNLKYKFWLALARITLLGILQTPAVAIYSIAMLITWINLSQSVCPNWFMCYRIKDDNSRALTHWPLGDLKIFFKMSFSNSYPESIPWAIPAKLLSEVCHRTPLMISQHWFR